MALHSFHVLWEWVRECLSTLSSITACHMDIPNNNINTLDSILNNSSIPSGNHNNNNNTINSNSSIPNISSNSVDLLLLSCLPVEAHPVYLKHNHLPLHLLLSCPTALFRQHLPQ